MKKTVGNSSVINCYFLILTYFQCNFINIATITNQLSWKTINLQKKKKPCRLFVTHKISFVISKMDYKSNIIIVATSSHPQKKQFLQLILITEVLEIQLRIKISDNKDEWYFDGAMPSFSNSNSSKF